MIIENTFLNKNLHALNFNKYCSCRKCAEFRSAELQKRKERREQLSNDRRLFLRQYDDEVREIFKIFKSLDKNELKRLFTALKMEL